VSELTFRFNHLMGTGNYSPASNNMKLVHWPLMSKGKGKGLDTCYSATYMSQTRDQQRFTISEVAAGWHEPMVPGGLLHLVQRRGDCGAAECPGPSSLY